MQQLTCHRMGKESPAYLDRQISTRTSLLAASSQKNVAAYFVKAMRHYSDKEILVVAFNTDNHWVTLAILQSTTKSSIVTSQRRQIQ
jgi:endonuclease/exonuclease/phosphatase (EEP) superfamily protein YafD